MPYRGEVLGGMTAANTTLIFPEGNIESFESRDFATPLGAWPFGSTFPLSTNTLSF